MLEVAASTGLAHVHCIDSSGLGIYVSVGWSRYGVFEIYGS